MQAAIAQAPLRSARDAVIQGPPAMGQRDIDVHAPRFFVQMGWRRLDVDSPGVPNGYLLRGEITPCHSTKKKDNLSEIPEGMLIQGSQEQDKDGREIYGYYWLPAFFEAQRLKENEAMSERKDGLIEIKALAANPRLYQQIDLNATFYPQGLHVLPDRNEDLRLHLENRIRAIGANADGHEPDVASLLIEIGQELMQAIVEADRIQRQRINYTHSCMRLAPKEEQFKREYDPVDYEMLQRTGEPEIHDAERKTATALGILAEDKANKTGEESQVLSHLIQSQQSQMDALREQMKADREMFQAQMSQQAEMFKLMFNQMETGPKGKQSQPSKVNG